MSRMTSNKEKEILWLGEFKMKSGKRRCLNVSSSAVEL